jgi:conjugative relaxase-like TrwC/TraI family protein
VTADLHKLSAGRADYYVREVARDHEEYLSGNGESPGEYLGVGCTALGKQGVCSEEEFRRLFAWRHPDTGEQLGRAPRSDAMPAWDLVLRPVKDVALLYALGDQPTSRAAMAAHQAGVAAAVTYLDSQVGTRTGRDGAKHVPGSGLVAVGFIHRISRAGDPLPHTHLVIVNRTQGPDGGWRTLDSRDLLGHRQAADAIYRATYQHQLTRTLGIAWGEPDRWGNRPIVGMPQGLVQAFSKRHEQIRAELERLEREEGKARTAKLIQYVAHATRPAKSHDTPETLHGRWQAEARERGVDPERLLGQVIGRQRELAPDGVAVGRVFDQLASPEGPTANASTFARREVLVALGGQLAAIGPAELERLADRYLTERCVSVMAEPTDGERRWTTPELLQVEQRLLEAAVGRAAEQVGGLLPLRGAGRAGRPSQYRRRPGGDGPRPHPRRRRRPAGGRTGRHRQDLRPRGGSARLAARRVQGGWRGPDRDRHRLPGLRRLRARPHRRPAPGRAGPGARPSRPGPCSR